jgi:hypothetical protein
MKKRKRLVLKDALGNTIYFPDHLCCNQNTCCEGAGVFDNVPDILQKPALLLRGKDNPTIHYYFRVVGIERSVLILAKEVEEVWKAFECVTNPDDKFLVQILSECEMVKSTENSLHP